MTRSIFLVTVPVETVLGWDKNENGSQDKNVRGAVCLALVFVAELVMLWYAQDTLTGSCTFENMTLFLYA